MKCCEDVRGSDCHCGRCHQTFRGLSLFDAHQDVDYTRTAVLLCRAPSEIGAVQAPGGTWCTPEGLKARQILTTRLATARAQRVGTAK